MLFVGLCFGLLVFSFVCRFIGFFLFCRFFVVFFGVFEW